MKLAAKQFLFVLAVTVVLLVGVGIVLSGVLSMLYGENTTKQFKVALAGDTDDPYMQWALVALQSVDEERFSVAIVEMPEAEAQAALEKGEISAYAILPQDFMENALAGDVMPVTYVTSAGLEGASGLLKREITDIVTNIVVQAQKGTFGLEAALEDHAPDVDPDMPMTDLTLEYTNLIFHRDMLYSVEELGISDHLSTRDYYLCAITVILLVLMGIPFAAVYIKKNYALSRLLLSRGCPAGKQLLCEFGAYLLSMLVLMVVVLLVGAGILVRIPSIAADELPSIWAMAVRMLPVIVMLTAMNMLMFTCCDNLVSGLLLHFFTAIGLCYISGCIYPVYAFPKALWPVAEWLPTGLARSHLATGFSENASLPSFVGLLVYAIGFYGITLLLRVRKTVVARG